MSRLSWFAIRTPLAPRRATIAKVLAFLLPLAAWAILCLIWVPDVIIKEQNDGPYKEDDRVKREDFELVNKEILDKPPEYRVTAKALQSMKGEVPDPVIETVRADVGPGPVNPSGFAYKDQKTFLTAFADDDEEEKQGVEKYKDVIWSHLEKETKQPEKGEPSTVIWLPSPWRVIKAFYHAFTVPPNGTAYKLTHDSFEALRKDGVPEATLAKLRFLTDKRFAYSDEDQFLAEAALNFDAGPTQLVGSTLAAQGLAPAGAGPMAPAIQILVAAKAEDSNLSVHGLNPDELSHSKKKILKRAYVKGDPWLHESLWHSCQIIFWGFIFSAIVGVPLGIICGTFDFFSKLTEPFIDFIRYMPAPAFGVLCVAILGINDGPKIAIIWIGTFFQMVLVVANTTRQFDPALLEAAQTLGASKRTMLIKVILPGILPNLYNDMRILIGWAWTYLIVAELIGASSGISYFISLQGRYRHFENVYAGICMIGIIGLTFDQILAALSRFLFPWVPKSDRGRGAWGAFFGALAFLIRGSRKTSADAKATPASA